MYNCVHMAHMFRIQAEAHSGSCSHVYAYTCENIMPYKFTNLIVKNSDGRQRLKFMEYEIDNSNVKSGDTERWAHFCRMEV